MMNEVRADELRDVRREGRDSEAGAEVRGHADDGS